MGIVLSATLFALAAQAASVNEKRCIFAAAQKLPVIVGLAITDSRFKPLPPDAKLLEQQNQIKFGGIVEIDVKAAAQDATFSFYCGSNDKTTIATPLGVSR